MKLTLFLSPRRNYTATLLNLYGKKFLQLPNNDTRKIQFEALTAEPFNCTYTDLHIAARAGQAGAVRDLIANIPQSNRHNIINGKCSTGVTPLLMATQAMITFANIDDITDYFSVIRLLLDAQADPNIKEMHMGWTPLHYAAQSNSIETTKLLVAYGAKINIQDQEGNTPLHLAIDSKNFQSIVIAKFLIQSMLENGIHPNSKNIYKQTPLDIARSQKLWDLAGKLQEMPHRVRPKHRLS